MGRGDWLEDVLCLAGYKVAIVKTLYVQYEAVCRQPLTPLYVLGAVVLVLFWF